MYNKVEICGVNTSRLPVLSSSEKKELLKRTKQGDTDAREKLIDGNLRLVLSIIQRFAGRGGRRENLDDLFQVGCIGLIKAVDGFDMDKMVEFSTYAVPMIIGEIRRYLRDNNSIRVSRSVRDMAYRALSAKEKLSAESGEEPTVEAIANEIGENVKDVGTRLKHCRAGLTLRYCLQRRRRLDMRQDQIKDEGTSERVWLEDIALKEAISKLSRKGGVLSSARYYAEKSDGDSRER